MSEPADGSQKSWNLMFQSSVEPDTVEGFCNNTHSQTTVAGRDQPLATAAHFNSTCTVVSPQMRHVAVNASRSSIDQIRAQVRRFAAYRLCLRVSLRTQAEKGPG
jgi:hypothetical protein